jgi:hypothetical protein
MSNTAIARIEDVTARPLVSVEDLRKTFDSLQGRANVLSPLAAVSHIKPLHQVSLRMVVLDPERECYQDRRFCGPDEYALGGVALQKLAGAAGVEILDRTRNDDKSDRHYCEITMRLRVQDFDGSWRPMIATKELDLRDGSEDAQSMKTQELSNARKHIQSLCETKAMYRALRKLFSIRQKYKKAELALPWVVPKLVVNLDLNDPDQKAAAIREATGATRALYGPGDSPAALPPANPAGTHPPPPVGTKPHDDEEEEDEDQASFDLPDFAPDKKDEPALILCLCPCGDSTEISKEVAEITTAKVGAPRCKDCYPNSGFNFEKHRDLPRGGLLNLPKHPELTAEKVRAANQNRAGR